MSVGVTVRVISDLNIMPKGSVLSRMSGSNLESTIGIVPKFGVLGLRLDP